MRNSRINRRQALVMALRPVVPGSPFLTGTFRGVLYDVFFVTVSGQRTWSVSLPKAHRRSTGPGRGGSYPSKGAALAAIADGTALAHAEQAARQDAMLKGHSR